MGGLLTPGPTRAKAEELRAQKGSRGLLDAVGTPMSYAPNPFVQMIGQGLLGAQYLTGEKEMGEGLASLSDMTAMAVGSRVPPLVRAAWKTVKPGEIGDWAHTEGQDEYLYHVTSKPAAQKIMKEGLLPRGGRGMFDHGGYAEHSKGRAFLTDRDGVPFWSDKIEQQLFDKYDNPPPVVVLKIPKKDLEAQGIKAIADEIGTKDARAPSWFIDKLLK